VPVAIATPLGGLGAVAMNDALVAVRTAGGVERSLDFERTYAGR